jgi:two-component system, LytTR family, sensor histidine kinase AlgZ
MRSVQLLFVAVGLLLACLVASPLALRGGAPWTEAVLLGLPLGLVYSAICIAARYPCRAAPLASTTAARIAGTHGTAAVLSAGAWLLIGSALSRILEAAPGFEGAGRRFAGETPTFLVVGILVYLLAVAVHYLVLALEAAREAEVRGVQARVLAREAELRALRAQVDPHFLFNSLNSISALTSQDPDAARRMCLLLAGFLRRSLALGSRDRIALRDELALVADYLAIEKVRFGERVRILQEVDEAALGCVVPPLLLQPLIENAVRHGVAHLLEGGTIAISARRLSGRIALAVENPRDPERPTSRGEGVGLANVRDRLKSLYGDEAQANVRPGGDSFRVEIALPAIEAPSTAPDVRAARAS